MSKKRPDDKLRLFDVPYVATATELRERFRADPPAVVLAEFLAEDATITHRASALTTAAGFVLVVAAGLQAATNFHAASYWGVIALAFAGFVCALWVQNSRVGGRVVGMSATEADVLRSARRLRRKLVVVEVGTFGVGLALAALVVIGFIVT